MRNRVRPAEKGYEISVSVTRNRLNDEAHVSQGMLGRNVSELIIEGRVPVSGIRICGFTRDTAEKYSDAVYSIITRMRRLTAWRCRMRAGYELTRILIQNGHTLGSAVFSIR